MAVQHLVVVPASFIPSPFLNVRPLGSIYGVCVTVLAFLILMDKVAWNLLLWLGGIIIRGVPVQTDTVQYLAIFVGTSDKYFYGVFICDLLSSFRFVISKQDLVV